MSVHDRGEGPIVRPYALTGGRTRPQYSYPLEALVITSVSGERLDQRANPESLAICRLCTQSRSVAEISAMLQMPFGVARVLVGDLAAAGHVLVHQQSTDAPDTALLERVLGGLRTL